MLSVPVSIDLFSVIIVCRISKYSILTIPEPLFAGLIQMSWMWMWYICPMLWWNVQFSQCLQLLTIFALTNLCSPTYQATRNFPCRKWSCSFGESRTIEACLSHLALSVFYYYCSGRIPWVASFDPILQSLQKLRLHWLIGD